MMPAFNSIPYTEMVTRLSMALVLGGALGLERQWKQRTAGLRTNVLVCIGAASFVLFSLCFASQDDVSKIAGYVISGIGFLGAGVIMKDGGNIKGINTAATLWCSTAIGMFSGLGMLMPASIVTLFLILSNVILNPLVNYINSHPLNSSTETDVYFSITLICRRKDETIIRELLLEKINESGLHLRKVSSMKVENTDRVEIYTSLTAIGNQAEKIEEIVGKLSLNSSIKSASWSNKTPTQ